MCDTKASTVYDVGNFKTPVVLLCGRYEGNSALLWNQNRIRTMTKDLSWDENRNYSKMVYFSLQID